MINSLKSPYKMWNQHWCLTSWGFQAVDWPVGLVNVCRVNCWWADFIRTVEHCVNTWPEPRDFISKCTRWELCFSFLLDRQIPPTSPNILNKNLPADKADVDKVPVIFDLLWRWRSWALRGLVVLFPSALSGHAESIRATLNHVSITRRSAEFHRAGPEMDHLQNRAEARPSVPLVAPLLSSYLWTIPEWTIFLKIVELAEMFQFCSFWLNLCCLKSSFSPASLFVLSDVGCVSLFQES